MPPSPYFQIPAGIAVAAFLIAFLLTLSPGRRQIVAAAVSYVAGMLSYFGAFAYQTRLVAGLGLDPSDAAGPYLKAAGIVLPLWTIGYAVGAGVLLSPSIPQKKALRFGKIWHLTIGLPLLAVQLSGDLRLSGSAGWLVYALLWFRIRDLYASLLEQPKGDPLESADGDRLPFEPLSARFRWGLYFGAWGVVILITLAARPAYLLRAASFPIGLFAMLPKGEETSITLWMLGPIAVGFGWTLYAALTFILTCTRKTVIWLIAYCLLCLLLALNAVGCDKMIEAAKGIH
jgi:hypothetical protein